MRQVLAAHYLMDLKDSTRISKKLNMKKFRDAPYIIEAVAVNVNEACRLSNGGLQAFNDYGNPLGRWHMHDLFEVKIWKTINEV